jgi:MAF protein
MKKKKIILGSSSEFRKKLFSTLNLDFTCISPDINESQHNNEKPEDMAIRLAIEKAKKICLLENNSLVISSDACASCDGRILGKPLTKDIAIEYLEYISSKTIIFHTSICVMDSDTMKYNIDIAKYTIKIKKLNTVDINNYVDTHKPYYSSAAFRYEVAKDFLIKEFNDKEDDISGLIGLPLKKLTNILKNYNVL